MTAGENALGDEDPLPPQANYYTDRTTAFEPPSKLSSGTDCVPHCLRVCSSIADEHGHSGKKKNSLATHWWEFMPFMGADALWKKKFSFGSSSRYS